MNEKIKNLFNICGMPNEDIMELFEDKNKTFYMEKFAELIIQECMEQCFSEEDEQRIAKHFGIYDEW